MSDRFVFGSILVPDAQSASSSVNLEARARLLGGMG